MTRRRILGIMVPLFLIGVTVASWVVLARRDADFVTVGPKTTGVRDNFVKLDTMIDPAEFRDCKTVQDAVKRLSVKLNPPLDMGIDEQPFRWFHRDWLRFDNAAFTPPANGVNVLLAPFALPADDLPMTAKQFLRLIMAQSGISDVNYIVRGHHIEITTSACAAEERARYLDSVSVMDRLHLWWKELRGDLAQDPPELLEITVW